MDIDVVIGEVAAARWGVVPRDALRERGVDPRMIRRRVERGVLEELSPRVLRLAGAPRSDEQRVTAGCLDVAGGAVASFDAAAWLWGLPGFALRDVEVTAKRAQHRTSTLAHVHRPTRHLGDHITVVHGIEVTDLPWTIFNLASRHHPKRIERVVDSVCSRSPSALVALHGLLPRMVGKGMAGCRTMRELLAARPVGVRLPGSGTQRRFEELVEAAGITTLEREVDFGGHEWIGRVDYRCRRTGIHYEIDSELHHTSPTDVAADALRDARMRAAGATDVVRISTESVWSRPAEAVRTVVTTRSRYLSAREAASWGSENELAG